MKSKGILVLLSILVIVLGFFAYLISSNKLASPVNVVYEKNIQEIEDVSKSDDLDDIEYDLDNTDLENIDTELTLIEGELN